MGIQDGSVASPLPTATRRASGAPGTAALAMLALAFALQPAMTLAMPWDEPKVDPAKAKPPVEDKAEPCIVQQVTADGIEVRFERGDTGFFLRVGSIGWRLGRDDVSYQVELAAGTAEAVVDAATSTTFLTIPLRNPGILGALRAGEAIDVRGEGSSVRAHIKATRGVLDSLDRCNALRAKPPATASKGAPGERAPRPR